MGATSTSKRKRKFYTPDLEKQIAEQQRPPQVVGLIAMLEQADTRAAEQITELEEKAAQLKDDRVKAAAKLAELDEELAGYDEPEGGWQIGPTGGPPMGGNNSPFGNLI